MNSEKNQQELENVRSAYRLLFLYQERMKDLAKFIGKHYGLSPLAGWSKFRNQQNGKNFKIDKLAWASLCMYLYEFHFEGKCDEADFGNSKFGFSVFIESDSGFYENNLNEEYKGKIDEFASVKESASYIHLVLVANFWDIKESYKWQEQYFSEQGKKTDVSYWVKKEGDKSFIIAYRFPIHEMYEEDSILACLEKFEDYCKEHQIKLEKGELKAIEIKKD